MRRKTSVFAALVLAGILLMTAAAPGYAQWWPFGGSDEGQEEAAGGAAEETGEQPGQEPPDPRAEAVAALQSLRNVLAAPLAQDLESGEVSALAAEVVRSIDEEDGALARLEALSGHSRDEFAGADLAAILEAAEETPEVLALVHVLSARARLEAAAFAEDLQGALDHVDQAIGLLSQ